MLSGALRPWFNVSCRRREGCLCLVLLLAAILLLLQGFAIRSTPKPPHHEPAGPASIRGLLQALNHTQEAISALSDAPDDDPFAGSHLGGPLLGRVAALLPKPFRHHLNLLRLSLARAKHDHSSSSSGFLPAPAARHHHRLARHNTTHSWVTSPVLQMELPQPWDTHNLTTIVRDNLEPDVLFWQQLHRRPSVSDIWAAARSNTDMEGLASTRRLVEIRHNRLRFPLMPPGIKQYTCDEECDPQLQGFVEAMAAAVGVFNLTLPDVLFIINTNDAPVCTEEQVMRDTCSVPIISMSKETGVADLVGPVMRRSDADVKLRHAPWADKLDKAFFRGVPSCGAMPFPAGCARSWVARMAQLNASADLDVGLVERYDRPDQVASDPVLRDGHGPLPVLPRVPMSELPRYRYLLNLDGHTAAYRLGHLLATNSLVLKQESSQVEHYYKSLRAYHHFVPILKHSQQDIVPRLHWARRHEAQVKHIIHNANRFALQYVTYAARVLYWKYVLLAYRSLVPDMDQYFAQSSATGTHMEFLLKSHLATIARQARNGNITVFAHNTDKLADPTMEAELQAVAALAGEDEAEVQEQELIELGAEPTGPENSLQALTGDED